MELSKKERAKAKKKIEELFSKTNQLTGEGVGEFIKELGKQNINFFEWHAPKVEKK